ncbi:MAG: hypothetical protein ACOYVD_11340 [Bacillota bacterium]
MKSFKVKVLPAKIELSVNQGSTLIKTLKEVILSILITTQVCKNNSKF